MAKKKKQKKEEPKPARASEGNKGTGRAKSIMKKKVAERDIAGLEKSARAGTLSRRGRNTLTYLSKSHGRSQVGKKATAALAAHTKKTKKTKK